MSFQLRLTSIVTLISAATLLSGCGGGRGGSSALPSLAMTPVATSGGDPTAQAAAATTAAQTVAALGTALPHVSLDADLAALAPAMVASGKFSSAQVVPGGISAQLPDGTPFAVFADHADDPTSSGASSAARSAAARVRASRALPSAQHLIAFLVNTTDQRGAFNPAHQQDYANALSALALGQAPYATAVSDVQLDSIAAFGSAQRLDLLDISTHGMVIYDSANKPHYVMLSDTQISPAAMQAYRDELKAGRVVSSTLIAAGYSRRSVFNPSGTATPTPVPPVYANLASLAFTPGFLTEHLAFNPGAV
ncbi:MAG: hypothetical protein JOZ24_09290, partial [Candidatus Eremiobacteraeota bacterium]|nr:hypothetical protein [Candidatus Eremiobacteraeota bacterium]